LKIFQTLRNGVLKRTFGFFETLGIHVLPVHFYSPIPDTRLFENNDGVFDEPSDLLGVEMNEERQIGLLKEICPKYYDEYKDLPLNATDDPLEYYLNNGSFGFVSGQMLYCVVRHFKPRHIIEVGSGHSTLVTLKAARRNGTADGSKSSLTAIEPYPSDCLSKINDENFKLIRSKVEDLPLSTFVQLEMNDILFIDSSHVSKIKSDVNYLMFEVIPRLSKGVIIHIHDIQFPFDYFKSYILKERHFWNEQYIVQAFLMFNSLYEVLWCGSYMTWKHPELLSEHFPHFTPSRVSTSLFIKKKE